MDVPVSVTFAVSGGRKKGKVPVRASMGRQGKWQIGRVVCKTRWRIAPSAAEGEEVPCRLMCAVGGAWAYRLAQSLCN